MCGITGAFFSKRSAAPLDGVIAGMNHVLAHRGPDSSGTYVDTRLGFGFGHTRLSILDPSPAGAQPIWSKDGSVLLVFNGEIYNHSQLRGLLASEGHEVRWQGHSDSETLVELLATWGPAKTLPRLVGMFAFASFNFNSETLTLARDRTGEKPLYFGHIPGKWGFASELSALEILLGDSLVLNEQGISHYMSRSFLPEQHSIYQQVQKLPGGTYITLRLSDLHSSNGSRPETYWSPPSSDNVGKFSGFASGGPQQNLGYLNTLLTEAIASQLQADVPVGAFLSGGVDSTLITAVAQKIDGNLKTFAVGFESSTLDEAPFAKEIAKALGCVHSEIYLSGEDMVEIATGLPARLDEPFADSSAIPTYALARFAKEQVSVALTGDGGDELFGGYPRYQRAKAVQKILCLPLSVRERIARTIEVLPKGWSENIFSRDTRADNTQLSVGVSHRRMRRYLALLRSTSELNLYQGLISSRGLDMLRASGVTDSIDSQYWKPKERIEDSAALFDFLSFLPGDILYKVDRSSMANSLETRAPLLDANVVEFAFRLHARFKHGSGQGKLIMRQLLETHLPSTYWARPKSGFTMPMAQLLRGELKDWASNLIEPVVPKFDSLFDYSIVKRMWHQHLAGEEDFAVELWNFLMLSSWLNSRNLTLAP